MIELSNAVLKAGIAQQQEYRAEQIKRACSSQDMQELKKQSEGFGHLVESNKEILPIGVSVVIPNMTAEQFIAIIDEARELHKAVHGYKPVTNFDLLHQNG